MANGHDGWIDYDERLRRVLSYIHDHLEEDIDFTRLAEVACLSPYHWHRIYRAIRGETLAATVKRLRLHHAAGRLANTDMGLAEIAARAGYGSVHAFTRAFGMPPATFRKTGSHTQFMETGGDTLMTEHPVEIKDLKAMRLATLPHTGQYMEIGKAFDQLFGWFGSRGLLGGSTPFPPAIPDGKPLRTPEIALAVALFFDDPDSVPEAELRSRAGIEVAPDFRIEPPLDGGRSLCGSYASGTVLKYEIGLFLALWRMAAGLPP